MVSGFPVERQAITIHTAFAYYSPMGGERASDTRRRARGEICDSCKVPLQSPPAKPRLCAKCARPHRIYMSFVAGPNGWQCAFLQADLVTPLRLRLTFATPNKIMVLAERGGALNALADRQALEGGIKSGRGGLYLQLTTDQLRRLA